MTDTRMEWSAAFELATVQNNIMDELNAAIEQWIDKPVDRHGHEVRAAMQAQVDRLNAQSPENRIRTAIVVLWPEQVHDTKWADIPTEGITDATFSLDKNNPPTRVVASLRMKEPLVRVITTIRVGE